MLNIDDAKKIGIRACMDKLGYDFCMKHRDNAVSAYGRAEGDKIECFVGVSDEAYIEPETPCLTSYYRWPFAARCLVDLNTGEVEFIEFRQRYSIETELRDALIRLSDDRVGDKEAEHLAKKYAPQFDIVRFPTLGHKGVNWYAKEILKEQYGIKEQEDMIIEKIIENIKASFAMSDMKLSEEDIKRCRDLLTGKRSIDKIIKELDTKYGIVRVEESEIGIINPYQNTKLCLTEEMLKFLNQYLLQYRDYPDEQIAEEFSERFGIVLESAIGIERDYVVFNRRRIYNRISQYEEMGKSQAEAAELISADFGIDLDNAKKYVFRGYADSIDAFGVFIGNPELVDAEIYEPHPPLGIDIRAYSRYIREHGLTSDEITPEIMEKFKTGKGESSETA